MNKLTSTHITLREGSLPGEMRVITALLHLSPAPPQGLNILDPKLEAELRQEALLIRAVRGDHTVALTFSPYSWPVMWLEAAVEVAGAIDDQHKLTFDQRFRTIPVSPFETIVEFEHGFPPVLVDSEASDVSVRARVYTNGRRLVYTWRIRHPQWFAGGIEDALRDHLLNPRP